MTVSADTALRRLEIDSLPTGSRVAITTSFFGAPHRFVFTKVDSGVLELDLAKSDVPAKLYDYIQESRNVQEVVNGVDIDMSEMGVYTRRFDKTLDCGDSLFLYAKSDKSDWGQHSMFCVNQTISKLEVIDPQPATA